VCLTDARIESSEVKWIAPENLVFIVLLFIVLSVSSGHGVGGYLIGLGVCVGFGAAMGLIGRRYPMIYRQNRRDRRRRSRLREHDDIPPSF
jgi:hypothetical protein